MAVRIVESPKTLDEAVVRVAEGWARIKELTSIHTNITVADPVAVAIAFGELADRIAEQVAIVRRLADEPATAADPVRAWALRRALDADASKLREVRDLAAYWADRPRRRQRDARG